ncbi:isoquinoline 1-oxidoreductase alpha subunit [Sinobacterium caligoides]|uniref:Isoquinoline 1-oxidoreductase alpha subunit n=1 Tax=Sinobacterium caligoides TaxID=933926 RepID=A0A3N2DYA4_9GAMM|nr:(2Fe-2S)-binding protein [Sinobacterium caligoides]ROS04652.1 isoquinoline 1-oxidoreductase alpha subunit [Sinobacterium caligoides]
MIDLTVNGSAVSLDVGVDTPVLWVLRDHLGLMGTKFGCGAGLCGACTIHLDGVATRSCILPIAAVAGRQLTTIEGLSESADHPLQRAWVEHNVPQCGYCQSGQLMSAAALLSENKQPSETEIDQAMSGNICRCGTYPRIKRAIQQVAVGHYDPQDGGQS